MTDTPAPTNRGSVFDPAYNTLPTQQPGRDGGTTPQREFGERPQAPQPGRQQGFDPNSAFNDAYNLVPTQPQDRPGERPEGPFDSKYNQLNKVSDFPAFKGRPQPFNDNGEVGKMYVDERTGLVNGIEFSDGSRKGQKQVFDRDAQGNITKIHILMPGQGSTPPQYLSFQKTEKGWAAKPETATVPGFRNLKVENGLVVGDFKVNAKGDFSYETPDKQSKFVCRLNGEKDAFDMREYSRERELKNGQKALTYWNGYEWLPGQRQQVSPGVIKVTFQPQPGKPTSMLRDANTNGFQCEFGGREQTQFKVNSWNEGRMTRTQGQATDTLYSTGMQNNEGKLQWRKGQEKVENGMRVVTFNAQQDADKVRSGELPQGSAINPQTGEVVSIYANGTQVSVDSYGRPQRYTYKNRQQIDVLRDANNDFRGFRRNDGTTILKGADLSFGNGQQGNSWSVQRPGQQPVEIQGALKYGNAGAFNILNAGNEGLTVDPEGVLSTKIGGQVVSDTPGPTTPPQPRPETPPAVRPGERPPEQQPPPGGDRPAAPGKAPITDAQMQALAAKYKVKPAILAQAKDRAERQGMHQTFTNENLDKLLQLADKHKLLADFTDGGVSATSKPGALMGKIIPELLADPDTAVGKLQSQMKLQLEKSLKDGGAPPASITRATNTLDQRFSSIKTTTQPFITDLKANRPAPTPTPTPQPTPGPR